jgi:hypothetical protein
MACKRSAVRSRLPPPEMVRLMHKVGVATVWIGLLSSMSGLVFGGIDLVNDGEVGIMFALIPVGFAMLLVGTAITQFSGKK